MSVATDPKPPLLRRLPPDGATASFLMGDPHGRADEQPVHAVTLDAFRIGCHPVTNADYAVFLRATGHDGPLNWQQHPFDCPDAPVCGVSWFDAVAYADWLGSCLGRRFHLPTEAQREYAARGGRAGQAYPWGDEPLPLQGPYAHGLRGPLTGRPLAVGDARLVGPNDFGLLHMADAVHEWCADYYAADWYRRSPSHNPRGPAQSDRRAARGGSWRHHVKYCRCAARSSLAPGKHFADFGFRVAASDRFDYVE